jgi:HAD superfamily hydrolase (TIGR01459 family)
LKKIEHLSEIFSFYDTYIIDLWGVMHNGIKLNPGAVEVVENLIAQNKRVVFLSNAPRPSKNVVEFLKKLKMREGLLKNVLTSGEAAIKSLKSEKFGTNFFHLGPQRDTSLFEGMEKKRTSIENCDFILCTGLFDEYENLDFYKNLFKNNFSKKLVCTNPDLTVHRGENEEYCAGKIAEIYSSMGGEVVYFGKPYKDIYELFINENEKNLIIGDNLNTDIKGANNLNIDSLFITDGVHRKNINKEDDLFILSKNFKVKIKFFQRELTW